MQILFATFDPPDPPTPGNVGHFCVVAVNIVEERFEILDSLRPKGNADANRVLFRMAHGIKKLWKASGNSERRPFSPRSIDHFKMHYVVVPKQINSYVFSFYVSLNVFPFVPRTL